MHRYTAIAVLLLAFGALDAPRAFAQAKSAPPSGQKSPALNELDCRTFLKLDGDERAYTIVYYHGFISGRLNQMELPVEVMATATDRVVDQCIDKPGDKVLAVFEQMRNQK